MAGVQALLAITQRSSITQPGKNNGIARYDGPANEDDMATAIASDSSGNV